MPASSTRITPSSTYSSASAAWPRELHRHREVRLVEARLALDGAEADRAKGPPASDQRRDKPGCVRDPPNRAGVLHVVRHGVGLGLQVR
jgi:hypothetical protein